MSLRVAGALLVGALALQGCIAPTALLAGISAAGTTYQIVDKVTTANAGAIKVACERWAIDKARGLQRVADGQTSTAATKRASDLAVWLDATCDPAAPPPTDPLAAAFWLIGLVIEHNQIMSLK